MNDQAMSVPVAVRERARRVRRVKGVQDRLFDLALQHWFEWLLAYHLPRHGRRDAAFQAEVVDTWAALVRSSRSNVEHSDTVLSGLLAEERAGWDWAASIHVIVLALPKPWQVALICAAAGHTQRSIADHVGVSQQNVSILLDNIKRLFLPALCKLGNTSRECSRRMGVPVPVLQFP